MLLATMLLATPMHVFTTSSAEETKELGRRIAKELKPGDVVALIGELGTGKTTFVQGLAEGLGVSEGVRSPSFIILNIHRGRLNLYHLDLYRVDNINELYEIGIEEFIYSDGVTVVEWAEKAMTLLPAEYLLVRFFYTGEDTRRIEVGNHISLRSNETSPPENIQTP